MAIITQLSSLEGFSFDGARLMKIAEAQQDSYVSAHPFPHIVIDDFLPDAVIDALLGEFPDPKGDVDWQRLDHGHERKLALADDSSMGPVTRHVLSQFNSSPFVNFLEVLTGISGLIPDPHFVGGGLHQIEPGGFLGVHADFNIHKRLRLDRRLNVLLYLNRNWKEEYGGHLQLWSRDMARCEEEVLPIAGRCVVFSTTDDSFHGHPEPLKCPANVTRKSLALYYYSSGRPVEETSRSHSTLFRSSSADRKSRPDVRDLTRLLMPPIMLQGVRSVRNGLVEHRQGAGARQRGGLG